MKRLTYIMGNYVRFGILFLILIAVSQPGLAQVTLSSNPASVQDTIALCNTGNDVLNISASGGSGGSLSFYFEGLAADSAFGSGPHSRTYTTPGVHRVVVTEYSGAGILAQKTVYVNLGMALPASFITSDTIICVSRPTYALSGGSPAGGYYTGPGVTAGLFKPGLAGLGTHTLWYHYVSGSCRDSASQNITVLSSPSATLMSQGSPIIFNGMQTYARCLPASSTFNFFTTTASSTYTSYRIDFGDGTPAQTGVSFPSPFVSHSYATTGFYRVKLALSSGNGCTDTAIVNVFYGSNPSVGLSIKGNNVKCLPRDSGGVSFAFPISNTAGNPPGTIYTIEVNDGTPPLVFTHPPPDSIVHTFYEPSCGYNTANFNNAFQVKITASTPCAPNSVATVEPILISDPPTAAFDVEPLVCIGHPVNIQDASWGSQNALTGCDTGVILVWEISPSNYVVNSGFAGNLMGSGNPMNWLPGTSNLSVTFQKTGYYTINQYVGNQAGCEIDTVTRIVCVDSVPDPNFGIDKDSLCAPDTVTAYYLSDLVNFCDTTDLRWSISPPTGWRFLSDTIDSTMQAYFFRSGYYTITVESFNNCDTSNASRVIKVQNAPTVFLGNDQAFCGVRPINFAQFPFFPQKFDSLATLSYHWEVLPDTGWSYIMGTDSLSEYPQMDFTSLGSYSIVHTLTNHCGTASDTVEISFFDNPKFIPVPDTLVCFNSDFYLKLGATSGLAPYYYQWGVLLSGTSSSGDSIFRPSIQADETIWAVVTDSLGCTDTLLFNINVAPEFSADAGVDQDICYTDTTSLTGTAYGGIPPYTYAWSPAIGLSDTSITNPVRYPQDTTITYTLSITDSLGCVITDDVNIRVYPKVNLDAGPDLALCYDSTLFTLNSQSHSGGSWSGTGVSGNTFDPIVAGLGTHRLYYNYTDAHGCAYLDSLLINVINIPEAKFELDPGEGCSPLSFSPIDSSSAGVSHSWYAGGNLLSTNNNPVFTFVNNGSTDTVVSIKLVIEAGSGCRDSAIRSVTIHPLPVANFSLPADICPDDTVQAAGSAGYPAGTLFHWTASSPTVWISNDSASAPRFAFADNKTGFDSVYTIGLSVTDSNGCADLTTRNITMHSRPVANFSLPASQCSPFTLLPTDLSSGSGLSYQWSITPAVPIGNASSNTPSFDLPVSNFDSVVYRIHLLLTNTFGCTDSLSKPFTMYPRPTAAFSPSVTDSCGPLTVTFTNLSDANLSGPGLLNFEWIFGNGKTSSALNPIISFTNTGVLDSTYLVRLIVTSQFGCKDTVFDTITVHPNPLAKAFVNQTSGCAPLQLDSTVIYSNAFPNELHTWKVLDLLGNVLYQDTGTHNINYLIANSGDSVMVRLIVESLNGCRTDSTSRLIYTIANPVVDFTMPDPVCLPATVTAINNSTGGVQNYWYLNDSLVSTQAAPTFTWTNNSYTTDSLITLKLVVEAGSGCRDSSEKTIALRANPLASFTMAPNACAPALIGINNTSQAIDSASYLWSASSPNIIISDSSAFSPTFRFPDNQSGSDSTFTIQLVVDANGCPDTVTHSIIIYSRPVAAFSMPASSCGPIILNPLSTSTGSSISYWWTVSPAIAIQGNTHHTPTFDFPVSTSDSVQYSITLMVTNANGCTDTAQQNYTVYPKPLADFAPSQPDSCGPFVVTFTNFSSPNQNGMNREDMSFLWDFGNGQTSTDSVPSITYTNSGTGDSTYFISLIATNTFGCSDTATDSVVIHPDPQALISATYTANCAPFVIDSTVVNAAVLNFANDRYYWEIINMSGVIVAQDSGASKASYVLTQPNDSVWFRLTATSPFGCKSDTSIQLFYTIANPIANFTPLPQNGCSPLTVTVADSSSPGAARRWFVNDSLYHIGSNPVFNFVNNSRTLDSTVSIKLVLQAGTGCKDSTERTVTINPMPQAGFTLASSSCPGDSIYPVDTSIAQPGYSFRWKASSPGVVFSNDTVASPAILLPDNQSGYDSTYQITLVITTINGCRDSTSRPVTVFSRPTAAYNIPRSSCAPVAFGPIDLSTGTNLQYLWRVQPVVPIQNGNTSTPNFNFPVSFNDSVVYTVKLILTDSVTGCTDTLLKPFTVYPRPTAGFVASRSDSCGPFEVTFLNTSTPNQSGMGLSSMSFLWDLGNGQSSTDSVPTSIYSNTGTVDSTYYISLIATNAFGCSDTISDSITVHPDPRVDFSGTPLSACAPFVVDTTVIHFTDYPGANNLYQWQFLDVSTGVVLASYNRFDSVSYALTNPGDSVLFRMIAFSPFGCKTDTVTSLFYAIGLEPIGFTASAYEGCSPLVVTLADTGNGFSSWQWFVNGQLVSTLKSPTLTFTNTSFTQDSIYLVKMIANNGNGCPDSILERIRVYAPVAVNFMANAACLGDSLQFVNTSTPMDSIANWTWDFGDGSSDTSASPAHRYAAPGQYLVSLTAVSIHACTFSYSDTVTQYPGPVARFGIDNFCGVDSACVNSPVTFFDSSSVAALGGSLVQWEWDILNDGSIDYTGQQPSHTFTTTGTYPVRMIVTSQYGCKDTVLRNVHIYERPNAFFKIDSIFECGPFQTSVTDSSYGLIRNYNWTVFTKDTGNNRVVIYTSNQADPNPLPVFQPNWGADTTYFIELSVSNCCGVDTYLDSLRLKPHPIARTVPSSFSGCTPLDVTFQLDGLVKGQPDYLVMDFGDGSAPDTLTRFYQINPVGDTIWVWGQNNHRFVNNGLQDTSYTVGLTAVNDCGDSTVSLSILVHPNNVQAFIDASPDQGCAPLTVTIVDRSFGGTATAWCLDYDTLTGTCNLPTAVGDSLIHTYTQPGTYVIAQFVNDICSGDTAYKTITVFPSPTALFSHSGDVCAGNAVSFTNLSTAGPVAGYQWNFGNGQTSILNNPVQVYNQPGIYPVCLTVSSPNGCTSVYCDTVEIYARPEIDFSIQNACLNDQPISFYDSSSVSDGQLIGTLWKFGDGNTSVSANPKHTYAAPGAYRVTLIHTSTYGCSDSATKLVNIFPLANADFDAVNASGKTCGAPQQYIFNNLSQGSAGFYWDFDYNGQRGQHTSTLNSPSYLYQQSGAFDVLLVATNTFGCTDSMMKTIYVRPVPTANFEGDSLSGCAPLTVTFRDLSGYNFNGPGGIVKWTWSFGDGSIVSGDSVITHTFNEPGIYSVNLLVETDGGCIDSITLNDYIEVLSTPFAAFTHSAFNSNTIQFKNLSTNVDANTVFYWSFGDGTYSFEKQPTHRYNVDLFENDYTFDVCLYTSNALGCGDTLCKTVDLRGYLLHVPNAFAPELTGVGDANVFLPKGHSLESYHLSIYDEWGNLVFESTALNEGIPGEYWDGKHIKNETDLPMGAYVWKIDAVFNDGTIWPGKEYGKGKRKSFGTVTLIR